jgi:hypothetical protein
MAKLVRKAIRDTCDRTACHPNGPTDRCTICRTLSCIASRSSCGGSNSSPGRCGCQRPKHRLRGHRGSVEIGTPRLCLPHEFLESLRQRSCIGLLPPSMDSSFLAAIFPALVVSVDAHTAHLVLARLGTVRTPHRRLVIG